MKKLIVLLFTIFFSWGGYSHNNCKGVENDENIKKDATKAQIKSPKTIKKEEKGLLKSAVPLIKIPNLSANKWYFTSKIWSKVKKEECNDCKKLCHWDPNDSGGITCAGIAIAHNKQWFIANLNDFHSSCSIHPGGKITTCKNKLLILAAKDLIWNKYAKKFGNCGKKPFAMIVDSSVLEGPINATKHIQKAANIKVDGLFGPNTLKYCQDDKFNAKKYTDSRIARFKTLKACKRYCNGWIKRAKRKLKEYNK